MHVLSWRATGLHMPVIDIISPCVASLAIICIIVIGWPWRLRQQKEEREPKKKKVYPGHMELAWEWYTSLSLTFHLEELNQRSPPARRLRFYSIAGQL